MVYNGLLTAAQVREMLQISVPTLHRWRKSGKLPYIKYNQKSFRYKIEDVRRILNEQG